MMLGAVGVDEDDDDDDVDDDDALLCGALDGRDAHDKLSSCASRCGDAAAAASTRAGDASAGGTPCVLRGDAADSAAGDRRPDGPLMTGRRRPLQSTPQSDATSLPPPRARPFDVLLQPYALCGGRADLGDARMSSQL